MTLDWFSLIAQLVNFVVLVALLRAFLYGPILRVMREREERLQTIRSEAEASRATALAELEALRDERAELDRRRRERLAEIELEAEALRDTRRVAVEHEAGALRRALADTLQRDREQVLALLRRRNAELLIDELDTALRGLADIGLEERAAAVFRRRLEELDADTRAQLRDAARSAQPVVATAFEPSDAVRESLRDATRELTGGASEPRFVRDERLLFGITLTVGGMRVDGSATGHLEALAQAFDTARRELARSRADAPDAADAAVPAAAPEPS